MTDKQYPDSFERAIAIVLEHEGGYSDDPDDAGGRTAYGLSSRFLDALGINVDLKTMTKDEAVDIYYKELWSKLPYDYIQNTRISTKLFDTVVNVGTKEAVLILQRACNSCGADLVEDGVWGPRTLQAVNLATPGSLLAAMKSEQACFYRLLVAEKPKNEKFLKGWIARARS